ncbi:PBECR4 domain-containing protein [Agathobacter sp.]|uniref:PBECR4 domain-containing protein n=1 Tax=Agathobacter sp. TaxID=2021311 RepID=UPI002A915666|nr:PBECR4 domain-containing protein [Agathobacter sp.]MDY5861744.1 PBECR4 domain-containing protein [Agathobacter sp.]
MAEPFFLGGTDFMRNIKDCVNAFLPLLNTEYEIVLGRKGVAVTLRIAFDKKDCFHLMGLQYLIDRPELNRDRGKVFDEIVAGSITTEQVESSDFYKKIEGRVNFLPLLEKLLDSNDTVFKYNKKANMYSMIDADYLMKNNMEERNLYLFLSHGVDDKYFCRSFFPEEKKDYTRNQASWTMLYKKKGNMSTGEEIILYDRLTKK